MTDFAKELNEKANNGEQVEIISLALKHIAKAKQEGLELRKSYTEFDQAQYEKARQQGYEEGKLAEYETTKRGWTNYDYTKMAEHYTGIGRQQERQAILDMCEREYSKAQDANFKGGIAHVINQIKNEKSSNC